MYGWKNSPQKKGKTHSQNVISFKATPRGKTTTNCSKRQAKKERKHYRTLNRQLPVKEQNGGLNNALCFSPHSQDADQLTDTYPDQDEGLGASWPNDQNWQTETGFVERFQHMDTAQRYAEVRKIRQDKERVHRQVGWRRTQERENWNEFVKVVCGKTALGQAVGHSDACKMAVMKIPALALIGSTPLSY